MKGKLLFVTGLAVGYVLGARAGRKRYDQIAAAANKVWQSPGIQKQVHAAQDYAAARVGDIPGAVFDGARKAATGAINIVQKRTTGKGPAQTGSSATQAARAAAAKAAAAEEAAEAESESEPLDG
ncbi:hypothetical protein [Gryllotalpicola protaetiae]|uniref:hypothetical protein n=1 Tax=Gryllotalpicola protaetiae TaxID=2419771 RepID=UPI0015E8E78A|nr:hypothetical protein [Gryllotalpicola protaetiae]